MVAVGKRLPMLQAVACFNTLLRILRGDSYAYLVVSVEHAGLNST